MPSLTEGVSMTDSLRRQYISESASKAKHGSSREETSSGLISTLSIPSLASPLVKIYFMFAQHISDSS